MPTPNIPSKFTIYNASAGSGKTYTLVKSFLLVLLKEPSPNSFKQLLAITFTNKAVAEMKGRIISSLRSFAQQDSNLNQNMFSEIALCLGISDKELSQRAKYTLHNILQNYAALGISTIDSFNQRLIRNFAFELRLNPEFEVSIDTDTLIRLSIDRLQEQIGTDQTLTEWLLAFSRYKVAANKSWNIESELLLMGKRATQENHFERLEALRHKQISNFVELRNTIINLQRQQLGAIEAATQGFMNLGLTEKHFSRGLVYKFFKKAQTNPLPKNLYEDFEKVFFTQGKSGDFTFKTLQKQDPSAAELVNTHSEAIAHFLTAVEQHYNQHALLDNALQGLLPLGVLSHLYKIIEDIKQEEGILPIYEFNRLINTKIKGEPTPFIYEKLGQRYKYFFIDEFQDTSLLQWNNFFPLADNSLSQDGSLMLVGDAKQAIYRWRGGNARQFINLYNKTTIPSEATEQSIVKLEYNYRSYQEVILFNNTFFHFIAQHSGVFSSGQYIQLYADAQQTPSEPTKTGGYVSIQFLSNTSNDENTYFTDTDDSTNEKAYNSTKTASASTNTDFPTSSLPLTLLDDANYTSQKNLSLHTQAVYELIKEETARGFNYNDICVLTRSNDQGSYIASELSKWGLPVLSSEALLLKNIPKVQFLMELLRLTTYETPPTQSQSKAQLLMLYEQMRFEQRKYAILKQEQAQGKTHSTAFATEPITELGKAALAKAQEELSLQIDNTLQTYLHLPIEAFFTSKGLSLKVFYQYSLYDGLCYLIQTLDIADPSDAYLSHLLSLALEYTTTRRNSLTEFLRYWNEHQNTISVAIPEDTNAVRIMTIHKSKGLEFPIVIYPLATSSLKPKDELIWWKPSPEWGLPTDKFPELLLSSNTILERALPSFMQEQFQDPYLDAINVLYVALTRAERHLHILTDFPKEPKSNNKSSSTINKKSYTDLFKDYLQHQGIWNNSKWHYTFGIPTYPTSKKPSTPTKHLPFKLGKASNSYNIVTNKGLMWNSSSDKAIEQGNIMHKLLAKVQYSSDASQVVQFAIQTGVVPLELAHSLIQMITALCHHPTLSPYFTTEYTIYNEVDLINSSGAYLRPDRLAISGNCAIVIDYKTGKNNPKYIQQLQQYKQTLLQMGYTNIRLFLVFIGKEINVEEIS